MIYYSSRLSLIWIEFWHPLMSCIDSRQTVLEHHRSFTPFISGLFCFRIASGHAFTYQSEAYWSIAVNFDGNGNRPGYTNDTFSMWRMQVELSHLVWSYNRTKRPRICWQVSLSNMPIVKWLDECHHLLMVQKCTPTHSIKSHMVLKCAIAIERVHIVCTCTNSEELLTQTCSGRARNFQWV